MTSPSLTQQRRQRIWLSSDRADPTAFEAFVGTETQAKDWPLAAEIQARVPIYDGAQVRAAAPDADARAELMAEWADLFDTGPGALVIRDGVPIDVIDRATEVFEAEIAKGGGGGDHFAKPGANDRVWNAAEKHCLADPVNFAQYYASDAIAMASEAWLGTGYQLTAQVNRVNPGGAAQTPHRDYHLGFMSLDQAASYPAQCHTLSPLLTLQGAVAHCDMPVESGTTMLLPYSQTFFEGYVAFGRPDFQAIFAKSHVQLPLAKGDMVFFNPALMHGAGTNHTKDVYRMANLLQVGSAFGRSIESVDRWAMAQALYPALLDLVPDTLSPRAAHNAIAASAEGYPFPTNLDNDPPVDGLTPKPPAQRMREALAAREAPQVFADELTAMAQRRVP